MDAESIDLGRGHPELGRAVWLSVACFSAALLILSLLFDIALRSSARGQVLMTLLFIASAGHYLISRALRALRARRVHRAQRSHPDEPWLWDHSWNPGGVANDADSGRHSYLGAMIAHILAALVALWLVWFEIDGLLTWPLRIMVLIYVVLLVLPGSWDAIKKSRMEKPIGGGRLRYRQFPFFLGRRVEAEFHPPRTASTVSSLKVALRFAKDVNVWFVRMNMPHRHVIWRTQQTIRGRHSFDIEDSLPVEFDLPAEGEPTDLSADLATYWEITVHAVTNHGDYWGIFLIPVYREPKVSPAVQLAEEGSLRE